MIQDPFKLKRYMNNLSYFDKLHLGFVKNLLLNKLVDKHNSFDLSSSFDKSDFQFDKKKKSVLLIGNATSSKNNSALIDNFDGDVIRFNRFKTGGYGVGEKLTHWAISKNIATNNKIYGNTLEELLKINSQKNKKLSIFVASFPLMPDFKHDSIELLDMSESFKIYKKMCQLYLKHKGIVLPYEDSYIESHGAFKPSTGVLVILNSLFSYKDIKITNFDSFRSNHYWKENTKTEKKKYQFANQVIGNHQPVLESSILKTLEEMKLISRL
jgi:hypothetical protein